MFGGNKLGRLKIKALFVTFFQNNQVHMLLS